MTPAAGVVAVAVSGGADSLALLHATWKVAQALGLRVVALHVHHGLQDVADEWPAHLQQECRRWQAQAASPPADRARSSGSTGGTPRLEPGIGPPLEVKVRRLVGGPAVGQSVEEWAREGRRVALAEMARELGAGLILLAHHQRDQAETFLLQALRGAGPQGLAGMARIDRRDGMTWARPWLEQDREVILAYGARNKLNPVHDPSNDDPRWARNRMRLEVWPHLVAAFPAAQAVLAASAQQCARALPTLLEGARRDASNCFVPIAESAWTVQVDEPTWAALSLAQRSQALRVTLQAWGLRRVPRKGIEAIAARPHFRGAGVLPMGAGLEVNWYRNRLQWQRKPPGSIPPAEAATASADTTTVVFRRSGARIVESLGGRLILRRARGLEAGLPGPLPLEVMLRARAAGDRFQRAPQAIPRRLKKQFQAAGVPAWCRIAPIVCAPDGRILLVPGLGLDARAATQSGQGWVLEWQPIGPEP